MARMNTVFLHGQVLADPTIVYDEMGIAKKGKITIGVMRRFYSFASLVDNTGSRLQNDLLSEVQLDAPTIITADEELLEIMATLRKGDMCDVKGVVTTKTVSKIFICKECSKKTRLQGQITFVTPQYLCRREREVSPEQARELLEQRKEISNVVEIIGTLCKDVEFYAGETVNLNNASYQIAVNRRIRLNDDALDERTDYPHVRVFGKKAKMDSECLSVNSTVLIKGSLQTKIIKRKTVCSHCGFPCEMEDKVTNIVSEYTGYLENFTLPNKEKTVDEVEGVSESEFAE